MELRKEKAFLSCRKIMLVWVGLGMLVFPAGCYLHESEMVRMPERQELVRLDRGVPVVAEFPADGHWHDSGYLALPGDFIRFEPLGAAAHLDRTALQVRMGRSITQLVVSTSPRRLKKGGEIRFRAGARHLDAFREKTVKIRIWNVMEKE